MGMKTFLAGKSQRLYKTSICGVALRPSSLRRTHRVRLIPRVLRAWHLNIFEQPDSKKVFFNTF